MRRLLRKLRTFMGLPRAEQALALELVLEMARARFELSWIPFRRLAPGLGALLPAAEEPPRNPAPDPLVVRVARVTHLVAPVLPWNCTCLVRAMAALRVLRRRARVATLHLGVRRGAGLEAHAWLCCDGWWVTGGRERAGYTPLGRFGGPP